ncbi:hypothetical protein QFC22_005326 [Naganishia vaughanmartiniae]|uniref:Uncharacterized protein n=1 Tax=Naganishia vaughanmartiniae TaxID=1424756 RepID=A0ACC2WTA7_9TREE|nr:hypothetical protein QFC22_005326 [Naganishia vaughanmartiniae]
MRMKGKRKPCWLVLFLTNYLLSAVIATTYGFRNTGISPPSSFPSPSHLPFLKDNAKPLSVETQNRGSSHAVSNPVELDIAYDLANDNYTSDLNHLKTDPVRSGSSAEPSDAGQDGFIFGKTETENIRRCLAISAKAAPVISVSFGPVYGHVMDCSVNRLSQNWNKPIFSDLVDELTAVIATTRQETADAHSKSQQLDETIHSADVILDSLKDEVKVIRMRDTRSKEREERVEEREERITEREAELDLEEQFIAKTRRDAEALLANAREIDRLTKKRSRDKMMKEFVRDHRAHTTHPRSTAVSVYRPPMYPPFPRQPFRTTACDIPLDPENPPLDASVNANEHDQSIPSRPESSARTVKKDVPNPAVCSVLSAPNQEPQRPAYIASAGFKVPAKVPSRPHRIRTPSPPSTSDSELELQWPDSEDTDKDLGCGSGQASDTSPDSVVDLAANSVPANDQVSKEEEAVVSEPRTRARTPPKATVPSRTAVPVGRKVATTPPALTSVEDARFLQSLPPRILTPAVNAFVRKSPAYQKKWKPTHPSLAKKPVVANNSSPTSLAPVETNETVAKVHPQANLSMDELIDALHDSITGEFPFGSPVIRALLDATRSHDAMFSGLLALDDDIEIVTEQVPASLSMTEYYAMFAFSDDDV